MKKFMILVFLLLAGAGFGADTVIPLNKISPLAAEISVSDKSLTGTPGFGLGRTTAGIRTFLFGGHRPRIRKKGTLTGVIIDIIAPDPNLTNAVFRVFRYNGTTYDQIGADTEDVSAVLAAATVSTTLAFTTPIEGVQRGDFLALSITTDGVWTGLDELHALDADDWAAPFNDADTTGDGVSFGTALDGYSFTVEAVMSEAPMWVGIGDSFMAGHFGSNASLGCYSFIEALNGTAVFTDVNVEENILGYLDDFNLLNDFGDDIYGYMNHGIGGSSSTQWTTGGDDLVTTWGIDYSPRFALISLGFNDLLAGDVLLSTYIANITDIVQNLQANGIIPVFSTILQWVQGDNTQQTAVRDWNIALKAFCAERNLQVIDAWQTLASPADEDIWDTTLYGVGVHPNAAGYKAIATGGINWATTGGGGLRSRYSGGGR